jgi:anaerobic selenocysteine-containing dehydrogenase
VINDPDELQSDPPIAFALGMARWIMENKRYDRRHLENANAAAANADHETAWTAASYLVKIEDGRPARYLRADEIGVGSKMEFVVSRGGTLSAVDPNDKKKPVEGDLEAKVEKDGIVARTAFELFRERAEAMSLAQYAEIAGVDRAVIEKMAKEFTAYGKQAVAELYRGPVQHTNGYYNGQAIIALNVLVGNSGWKGGMAGGGYPYPIKVLFLHKGTPVLSTPAGHKQIDILRDTKKIPLFIACDILIGETSMYADYIFPDTAIWERWGTPHATPACLTKVSKVRQPTVAPLVETVKVDGTEMPDNMESFLLAVGKKLGLPGFGKDAFGIGKHFHHQDDWYLKAVANIAMGDKKGDPVPAADAKEMEVFRNARKHLPRSVFDEDRWKNAAGPGHWPHVVYALNRGGRFEDTTKIHKGDVQAHPFKGMFQLFVERVAKGRNSISGEHFDGLPRVEGPTFADGKPVGGKEGFPFLFIPFRNSTYNLQIGEARHGSDPIRIAVKLSQCLAERILDSIE